MSLELRAGPAQVAIFPDDGGRIGQIVVDGHSYLRGPEDARVGWAWWGSYPLLPWSNRIPGGRFSFEGRELSVPVNHDDGSALHGLAAQLPWVVERADDDTVQLAVHARAGSYDVGARQTFRLTSTHLDQTLEVTNLGDARVPVGLGIHPWFQGGRIRVPAEAFWPGRGPLPDGRPIVPVGPNEDLRETRTPPVMDRCYTSLTDTAADIRDLRLHWSGPITHVVVYTGVRGFVCVEPVTMANNGFALAASGLPDTGVFALDPGASTEVSYRFEWSVPE